jgi:DNA-binding NtrC family response regulator
MSDPLVSSGNGHPAYDLSTGQPFLLIVDDEIDFTDALADALRRAPYEVEKAYSGYEALQMMVEREFDLVILDLKMPLVGGLETLKRIRDTDDSVPVIVLTADHNIDSAVEAMRLGAFDYLCKPVDMERLRVAAKNALMTRELRAEVMQLRSHLISRFGIDNLIGVSSKMQEVFKHLERVIHSNVTVSLRGESGTGKELLARAIHFNGPRKDKEFVVVNCAAIPETLLESELFGHEKGAFTGAANRRIGKFEQANGGTLFLDEIGDMTSAMQVKILRALQERCFERVGGNQSLEVDVRVLSATNKNLEDEMTKGNFREDLYYRICVYPIFIPPLRERREDIPALVEHFIEKYNEKVRRSDAISHQGAVSGSDRALRGRTKINAISNRAMEYLIHYSWPGNVRELENVIERSLLNATGSTLLPEHLPLAVRIKCDQENLPASNANGNLMDLKEAVKLTRHIPPLREIEKALLQQALKLTDYNMSIAAARLGIGRTTLYRKLQKYKIPVPRWAE